jgi:Ring finger domain
MNEVTVASSPRRARSKSVSDSSIGSAAASVSRSSEEIESSLFPSPSVGHFSSLRTVLSGDEDEDSGVASASSARNQEQGEARPLLPLHEPNTASAAPLFPFDHFDDPASTMPSRSREGSGNQLLSEFNHEQCLLPMGGDDASPAPQQPVYTQRQRSRRRLLLSQQQQQQRSSASTAAPPSTVSSSSARASSESATTAAAAASSEKVVGASLRASLDAGMLAVRNWIKSHKSESGPDSGAARRPASASSGGNAIDDLEDENNALFDTDDDLFPTIFEMDEPSLQSSPNNNDTGSTRWRRGGAHDDDGRLGLRPSVRQRTRSEPDSAGLHEYFLHSSVRRRRRRASTIDERNGFDQGAAGTNLFGSAPSDLMVTPPRRRGGSHLAAAQTRLSSSGERLSSSAAAALSWNSAATTPSTRNPFDPASGGPADARNPRQRQPSLDAQQMLLLLTPTPSTDDHPLMDDENYRLRSLDTLDDAFPTEPNANFTPGAAPSPFTQASTRSVSGATTQLPESQQQQQAPFGADETTRPEASAAEIRDREARLRWIRINRRFQIVITTVALIFSVVLFAILLCWVVLTSTYVVSLDKPCDVNLKAYFWLVTLQLVLDVFRSDILRFVFRWDANSSDRIPCRVIAYNMIYLLYALMVLRLGITSVYVGNPTCKSTAPELFKASTAFVSLSLAAWGIILFGYVVPLFVVAALLTYNGYNPTDASSDARPAGGGPTPVFPAAYSMNGAPPGCIEQLERVGIDEVRGQDCCICMEDFDKDDVVVRTACSHCFHKQCCREWLRQARTCPVCRADIPSTLPNAPDGGTNNDSQHYSEGMSGGGGGEPPSRIPLGPTGRPVRGLFMRVFRRTDSETASSPPQSSSSNVSSRGGGAGGGNAGGDDVEMGISSSASPRVRY